MSQNELPRNEFGLTSQQARLAEMVAAGWKLRFAGRQLNISDSTIYRWAADDGFKRYVARLQTETTRAVIRRLDNLQGRAIRQLTLLLGSADEGVRLKAASTVLTLALRYRESGIGREHMNTTHSSMTLFE